MLSSRSNSFIALTPKGARLSRGAPEHSTRQRPVGRIYSARSRRVTQSPRAELWSARLALRRTEPAELMLKDLLPISSSRLVG